jgi:hypothetical protein
MEPSLRVLLAGNNLTEQTLLNVYNKLSMAGTRPFAPDLYILAAEKLFELPPPVQKHIVDKVESLISIYNRLQEPPNQFLIRALVCESLVNSHRARTQRGVPATEFNLRAIDYMFRALRMIQANVLYQPLGLRAAFLCYEVVFPFFSKEQRHHLQTITPLALGLLEAHLSGKYDATLRLYVALALLHGCLLDDVGKSEEASKLMQKLFAIVPNDLLQLRYSLLHILAHFSRKSTGGLQKLKLDLNEQLQKAIVLYQTVRSNNLVTSKDLAEVLKICAAFLDSRKDPSDETHEAEIVIAETGRLAAQFGQNQLADECQTRIASARSPIAHLHSTLITAELVLNKHPS